MDKFWELMEESVIVQGTITFSLVLTVCVMAILGREIPDLISTSLMLVLGWYFGAKTQQVATVTAKKVKHDIDSRTIGSSSNHNS